jgi:predicted transcriptional regulator of viral defense system
MSINDLSKLNNLYCFNKQTLRNIFPDVNQVSLSKNISRWIKSGKIISLKRGLYMTKDMADEISSWNSEFGDITIIANVLREPSYVSLAQALSHYGVLTEAVFVSTSVTLKRGETYVNRFGTFKYYNIKESLFTGYKTEEIFTGNRIYFATKAKALFDFLYFRTELIHSYGKDIDLVEDLRLNMDMFADSDYEELLSYLKIEKNIKLGKIINNIITNAKSSNHK